MRISLLLAILLLPFASGAAVARSWFDDALLGMEVGPTGAQFGYSDPADSRYARNFNGADIVERARAAGVDYLVIWARDGDYAYYNSKILPKAPGLGDRDPLREAMDAARPHHLPVIAYCVVQQGGHFLKEHPEFEMRDSKGNRIGRFCYNSGYLEAMKPIVAEQLAYGIAGFHIDMLDQGFGPPYGCWCDACRKKFQAEFGREMPAAPWTEGWDSVLEFRYRTSERFEKELRAFIRSVDPNATVDYNYHGNPPFSFEVGQRPVQHAGNADFVTGETGAWGFSALTVGLNAAFYQSATPGTRVQVAMQRGVRMYHDQTTRPEADLRWELLTLLSHGSFVTLVDKTGFDGSLDPRAYDRIGRVFADAHRRRLHFGQPRVEEVGIYFSSRTRDWVGRDKPFIYFQSFLGAHKALAYEHVPWGIILDEHSTPETLRRFPAIMVPNAGIISEAETAKFAQYVSDGGNLVLTGESGLHDRFGNRQSRSALEELAGGRVAGRLDSQDNWFRFSTADRSQHAQLLSKTPADWPFLVKGPAVIWEPTTATPIGQLMRPFQSTRQKEGRETLEWPQSAEAIAGPAILFRRVGRGSVLTFAGSPDFSTASEHHIVETRKLLAAAAQLGIPRPRVRIEAPTHVESVVTDDPKTRTLRIHFIAYSPPAQTMPSRERPYVLPGLMEDLPLFRAQVEVMQAVKRVAVLNKSTRLERKDRVFKLVVEDVHEVLVVNY